MAIGKKLEDARNRKGISIREASESTKIRGDFLTSFEAGNFDINLPEVYLRGFIRVYARFLGIDQESAVADLNLEIGSGKNKSSKKPIGKISGTEISEPTSEHPNVDAQRITRAGATKPNFITSTFLFWSISGASLLILILVLIISLSTDNSHDELSIAAKEDEPSSIIRETKMANPVDGAQTQNKPDVDDGRKVFESTLRLAAVGPIERLIISDEGKTPKAFHEFKQISTGWEKSISFTNSFRCYCSSLENIRFAVNDGLEKQVNGEGAGNFSWEVK